MLYYLAVSLTPRFGFFNALTYLTTRAGGAAVTAFLLSLVFGPAIIRGLRALKIGQYIREQHVADLHALHKGKAGTPTMGGTLIIVSTAASALMWARLSNRLLWVALGAFCVLGAVGFLDDYIKLRRKQNEGLSAKAKFAGQIVTGLLLGLYLVAYPITPGPTRLTRSDVESWEAMARLLDERLYRVAHGALEYFDNVPLTISPTPEEKDAIIEALNKLILETDLYAMGDWSGTDLNGEGTALVEQRMQGLTARETQRLNRLLLQARFPAVFAPNVKGLHTKVGVPGLKDTFIPLGIGYVILALLVIVGSSNAVNLTDGLDGLAVGASIMSLLAYTAIAYTVSRADWSHYLYLVYVPEASELTVLGGAMLGAGLGFLWFNSHPAEVFMGDTGSLALGGVIGTMALLTKQELLLVLVGGLFVMEAGSVIIQVASYKLTGKRVFKMAPIHHHFELLGWSETKVTIRFWILALIFALMSLGTLKLR